MLGPEYKYPEWSLQVGYALTASSILCIPVYIVYKFAITPGGIAQVLKTSVYISVVYEVKIIRLVY